MAPGAAEPHASCAAACSAAASKMSTTPDSVRPHSSPLFASSTAMIHPPCRGTLYLGSRALRLHAAVPSADQRGRLLGQPGERQYLLRRTHLDGHPGHPEHDA